VQRHADRLAIERLAAPQEAADAELSWLWRPRVRLRLPGGLGELTLGPDTRGPIDLDRLPKELVVRLRRGGERLRPRSGGPTRTLKSLLQEAQLPVAERARLPLVFAGERLVAVGDLWSDASVHAGPDSVRRARIRWRRK
jgi:tRNA(Ile)-lysidine synthase